MSLAPETARVLRDGGEAEVDVAALRVGDVVAALGLEPHPEGGFFRETFRSADMVMTARGPRPAVHRPRASPQPPP